MPAWIHDRAMRIKREGKLEEQYGKEKGKQVAFALATQQAHRLGKSPKTFKSKVTGKKETFGTPEGRREAKVKYDQPRSEYRKTASALSRAALGAVLGGGAGAVADPENRLRGAGIGAAGGAAAGALSAVPQFTGSARVTRGAVSGKARQLTKDRKTIENAKEHILAKVRKSAEKKVKEGMMVTPMVRDLILDILDKTATEEKEGGILSPSMMGTPLKARHRIARAIAGKVGIKPKQYVKKFAPAEGALWG